MSNKEIEIIFNDGDNEFRYSTVRLKGDHTTCLTNDDLLNLNNPNFVNKCMESIKPLKRLPLGQGGTWTQERVFSHDGRGMIIQTLINGEVVDEEREIDYILRHQKKDPPKDHQVHGFDF